MIEKVKKRQLVRTKGGVPVEIDLDVFRASFQRQNGTIVSRDFELEIGAVIWLAQMEKRDTDHEVIELTIFDESNVATARRHDNEITPCDPTEAVLSLARRGWKKISDERRTGHCVQVWSKKIKKTQ